MVKYGAQFYLNVYVHQTHSLTVKDAFNAIKVKCTQTEVAIVQREHSRLEIDVKL